MKGIKNGKIILEDGILEDRVILFEDKIIDIVSEKEYNLSTVELIDVGGSFVSPGFINIHVHGCSGYDFMDEEGLEEISKELLKTGVTSFLATTMSLEFEKIERALRKIKEFMIKGRCKGLLGVHLEGPFISKKYKGAHDERFLIDPDFKLIEPYKDVIKIVTLAPELEGAEEFIKKCSKEGIVISIGHSGASFEGTLKAIEYGAKSITHTFNAMPQLHHRNPSVLGAAFTTDVYCEVIPDNIHIHPYLYEVLIRIKGKDRIILVTDSNRACLLRDGEYELGGQAVTVKNGKATLRDGTIAGSVLRMNEGIRNFYKNTNLEIWEAVKLATINPARLLGIYDKKGSIEAGKDAEFCILDEEFNIVDVIM
ncbi:N-acetylglucosamine-6-phosphate deacetylase [Caloramator sp. CAR-1]|uniref:N-acetylglucosamine-6-phosphate deacetylase n=1 Tax=Caloramator sp. CAR-1 TaxID=3062777 RepID=UPI0026E1177D|nr:N-acetylglucosamine-6-phosphate deacetylase [Caloramator sp. CAR-1]MDO6354907.1 N-acetylglucosamine-6-phosphate deacetylase [Caloramator sp. CAR-1]